MQYKDFIIQVSDYQEYREKNKDRVGAFKVFVYSSPAGEMTQEEAVPVVFPLRKIHSTGNLLAKRGLDREALIAFGRTLALLLLPADAQASVSPRNLFAESYKMVGADGGLRLRLRLPPDLAVLPWEYLYTDRAGGGDRMDGFLALDPKVAIVRHQALAVPPQLEKLSGNIRVLVTLASPPRPGLPELDLNQEQGYIQAAITEQKGLEPVYIKDTTLQDVLDAIPKTGIFHFAGHGIFLRDMSSEPGKYAGKGALILDDREVDAEQLGINLRSSGVRLAVLGACDAGRSESITWWDGVAQALVKAEIPAVVGYQFTVRDDCAIAFARQFYQSLAGGLSIERAVSAGRIAAYNADKEGRDWGNPVLYLRAQSGDLFDGAADVVVREEARSEAEAVVKLTVGDVAAGGEVIGTDIGVMWSGKLITAIEINGTIWGNVTVVEIDRFVTGKLNIEGKAKDVGEGGEFRALKVDVFGIDGSEGPPSIGIEERNRKQEHVITQDLNNITRMTNEETILCQTCGTANPLGSNFCMECGNPRTKVALG